MPKSSPRSATDAGLTQVIYLGGLGESADDLSEHLRSRREVESILLAGAPTTALRAGLVIGDGGISWEILRQLVERLPAMVTPRWVQTRTQPISLGDALAALVGVLGRDEAIGETYEIGGPDVLTYRSMMRTAAADHGSPPTDPPRPPPLAAAVLALVASDHGCGLAHRSCSDRLDDERGRRPRPPHRRARGTSPHDLR